MTSKSDNALRVGSSALMGGDLWLRVNQRCNDVCMAAWKAGLTDQNKSITLWRAALRLMEWLKQHRGSPPIEGTEARRPTPLPPVT